MFTRAAFRSPCLLPRSKRPPSGALPLLAACVLLWATGCAYVGPQRANVAPLRDLPVAKADVGSLLPLFPDAVRMQPGGDSDVLHPPPARIMVAGGVHLGTLAPY